MRGCQSLNTLGTTKGGLVQQLESIIQILCDTPLLTRDNEKEHLAVAKNEIIKLLSGYRLSNADWLDIWQVLLDLQSYEKTYTGPNATLAWSVYGVMVDELLPSMVNRVPAHGLRMTLDQVEYVLSRLDGSHWFVFLGAVGSCRYKYNVAASVLLKGMDLNPDKTEGHWNSTLSWFPSYTQNVEIAKRVTGTHYGFYTYASAVADRVLRDPDGVPGEVLDFVNMRLRELVADGGKNAMATCVWVCSRRNLLDASTLRFVAENCDDRDVLLAVYWNSVCPESVRVGITSRGFDMRPVVV